MTKLEECIKFCETNYEYYRMRPGYNPLAERYSSIVCFLIELKALREGGDDSFVLGYKQAFADCQEALKKSVAREVEKCIIEGEKKSDWDFHRDYHGQFKKKEADNDGT